MKHQALLVAALVSTSALIAGCAAPAQPISPTVKLASDDATVVAKKAAFACTKVRARELDDKVSPANEIGRKIAVSCFDEWAEYARHRQPQGSASEVRAWQVRNARRHKELSTMTVLLERHRDAGR